MIELKHYLIECMRVGLVVLWVECDIWPKKTHRRSIPERGHWTDRHDTIWVYLKRDFHDLSLKSSSDSTKHGYCNHRIGRFSHVFPTFSVKPILPACLRLLLIQRNFFWWRCNTSPPLRRYGIFYTSHSHSRISQPQTSHFMRGFSYLWIFHICSYDFHEHARRAYEMSTARNDFNNHHFWSFLGGTFKCHISEIWRTYGKL